jgi:D-amino peptidase
MAKLKIYMMTDLEGVSGVQAFDDRSDTSPAAFARLQQWRRLLTAEANAAIEGAFAAGATEIVVRDGHAGDAIDFEQIDPRVRVVHGQQYPTWCCGLDETCDAMFTIGAHAMAGTRGGVLYHTWSAQIREIRLCGKAIGEIGLEAFAAGACGVPLIYVAGDMAACREAEALIPNITTAAVKEGVSRYAAISHPPTVAHRMIAEGAQRAIANLQEVKPFLPPSPYTWQLDEYPAGSDVMASNPANLPSTWSTVQDFQADTPQELMRRAWGRDV